MLINVSGTDLCGKNTLINELLKKIKCTTYHFTKPKSMEDAKNQYFDFIKNNDFINNNIITNRFHEGEWIYPMIDKSRNYVPDYLNEIENELKNIPYLYIYLYTSSDIINNRLNQREEEYIQQNDFLKLKNLYNKFNINQSLPYIKLINNNLNDLKNNIDNILFNIDIVQQLFNNKCDYYGNLNAKYLIKSNKQNILNSGIYYDSLIINDDKINIYKKILKNIIILH